MKGLRGFGDFQAIFRYSSKIIHFLLMNDGFKRDDSVEDSFNTLKAAMTHMPVLALPAFVKLFETETYTSGIGVRAVLLQAKKTIAYL